MVASERLPGWQYFRACMSPVTHGSDSPTVLRTMHRITVHLSENLV